MGEVMSGLKCTTNLQFSGLLFVHLFMCSSVTVTTALCQRSPSHLEMLRLSGEPKKEMTNSSQEGKCSETEIAALPCESVHSRGHWDRHFDSHFPLF